MDREERVKQSLQISLAMLSMVLEIVEIARLHGLIFCVHDRYSQCEAYMRKNDALSAVA